MRIVQEVLHCTGVTICLDDAAIYAQRAVCVDAAGISYVLLQAFMVDSGAWMKFLLAMAR